MRPETVLHSHSRSPDQKDEDMKIRVASTNENIKIKEVSKVNQHVLTANQKSPKQAHFDQSQLRKNLSGSNFKTQTIKKAKVVKENKQIKTAKSKSPKQSDVVERNLTATKKKIQQITSKCRSDDGKTADDKKSPLPLEIKKKLQGISGFNQTLYNSSGGSWDSNSAIPNKLKGDKNQGSKSLEKDTLSQFQSTDRSEKKPQHFHRKSENQQSILNQLQFLGSKDNNSFLNMEHSSFLKNVKARQMILDE